MERRERRVPRNNSTSQPHNRNRGVTSEMPRGRGGPRGAFAPRGGRGGPRGAPRGGRGGPRGAPRGGRGGPRGAPRGRGGATANVAIPEVEEDVQGISFTHFFAVPVWDNREFALDYKKKQDSFESFVKLNYPEFHETYSFQSHKSLHVSISMVDLRKGNFERDDPNL